MNKSILGLFIFLALAASQAHAQAYPPNVNIPVQAVGISLLALTVSLDVVAIGYIVSKIFPTTGVGNWLRDEYWEIAKSAMLIASIYAVIAFMTNISLLFLPSGAAGGCPGVPSTSSYMLVNGACSYISSVEGQLSNRFTFLLGLSTNLGAFESLIVQAYIPIPIPPPPLPPIVAFKFGFDITPYANSMLEGNTGGQFQSVLNDVIAYLAFPVALLLGVQDYLLPFLFLIGLTVIIPLGLVFRAMPFTRSIGGTLIGIGIGIAIIYPSMLIVLNYPVTNALQTATPAVSSTCTAGVFCYAVNFVGNLINFASSIGLAFASLQTMIPALDYIVWYSVYLVFQLLLFILDLGIGYSLANGIARLLGGNISLRITGKLKLA
jgi:hypothetical protein